jgi:hypothetical protein
MYHLVRELTEQISVQSDSWLGHQGAKTKNWYNSWTNANSWIISKFLSTRIHDNNTHVFYLTYFSRSKFKTYYGLFCFIFDFAHQPSNTTFCHSPCHNPHVPAFKSEVSIWSMDHFIGSTREPMQSPGPFNFSWCGEHWCTVIDQSGQNSRLKTNVWSHNRPSSWISLMFGSRAKSPRTTLVHVVGQAVDCWFFRWTALCQPSLGSERAGEWSFASTTKACKLIGYCSICPL